MSAPFPSGRPGGIAFKVRRSADRLTTRPSPAWADALALIAAFAALALWSIAA